ncbi:MAG TPA: hypothetical protein VG326_14085 [Tepidisphaeraceae bacterium]|jgi:hypothetical protein|nr:hypothetical protein [Tepidisphaeraceae bacterium]
MFLQKTWIFASLLSGLLGVATPGWAGMSQSGDSVTVNAATDEATFTIAFPHVPDFYSLDAGGRPVDSFQVEIAANPTGPDPLANLTTIIRGSEIRFANALRVRNASPPDLTDPQAGAWGSLRGTTPFTVHGNDVTFTTPFSLIDVSNRQFAYRAFTVESGSIVETFSGRSVPLPPAWAAMLLTGMLGIVWRRLRPAGSFH